MLSAKQEKIKIRIEIVLNNIIFARNNNSHGLTNTETKPD
jgi:hypothetical protein